MALIPNATRAIVYTPVTFAWDVVGGAGSYQLEIGRASGATDYLVLDVGNVLTYLRSLARGTYYWRVKAVISGTPGPASTEQFVMVP